MILQEPLDFEQEDYLRKMGIMKPDEQIIEYHLAGEGNMNVVIRVRTQKRNFILKQSRPFVNKYPHIPAPLDRILVEKAYYDTILKNKILQNHSPEILAEDRNFHILAMEDLGYDIDLIGLYKGHIPLDESQIEMLIQYLVLLHELPVNNFPDNSKMKKLNHEHIFQYPFMVDNGFDLNTVQPGLQQLSMKYKTDNKLKSKIGVLGNRYLQAGKHLLHGDFYPGSWLKAHSGIKVIDPEFSFMGDPEFDLGVMLSHLRMAKIPKESIHQALTLYQKIRPIDLSLLQAYSGVELLRRLIGLAQLPLALSLEEKENLMKDAVILIKS